MAQSKVWLMPQSFFLKKTERHGLDMYPSMQSYLEGYYFYFFNSFCNSFLCLSQIVLEALPIFGFPLRNPQQGMLMLPSLLLWDA
jgi:hypothetical protein